jgi:hypothetical protein
MTLKPQSLAQVRCLPSVKQKLGEPLRSGAAREAAKSRLDWSNVIARSQRVRPSAGPMINSATKQSILSLLLDGLLRFARNDVAGCFEN